MTAANMRLGAPPQVERITKSYKTTLKEIRLVQLSFKLNCTKRIWPHVKAAVTPQHSAAAMNFRFFENWPRITRGYILHKTVLKITTAVPSRNTLKSFPNVQWLSVDKSVHYLLQNKVRRKWTPPTGDNTPPSSSPCEKAATINPQKIVKGWEPRGWTQVKKYFRQIPANYQDRNQLTYFGVTMVIFTVDIITLLCIIILL